MCWYTVSMVSSGIFYFIYPIHSWSPVWNKIYTCASTILMSRYAIFWYIFPLKSTIALSSPTLSKYRYSCETMPKHRADALICTLSLLGNAMHEAENKSSFRTDFSSNAMSVISFWRYVHS